MAAPNFTVVQEPDEPTPEKPDRTAEFLFSLLLPLSQKALIALGNLFSLITVISMFWLVLIVVPADPSVKQLAGLGGYAAFVLIINWIVRRR